MPGRGTAVALAVALMLVASCWRGGTNTPKDPDETEAPQTAKRDQPGDPQQVQFLKDSEPTEPSTVPAPGTYVIAGCNTGCNGCSIGHSTDVHGIDVATGKELFPHPNPNPGGGYSCSAALPLGTHVKLVAKSGDGLVLDRWRPFSSGDYCPCAGTNTPICDVKVTQEIAAKFTRVYCGADWKQQGSAQIGH